MLEPVTITIQTKVDEGYPLDALADVVEDVLRYYIRRSERPLPFSLVDTTIHADAGIQSQEEPNSP